MLSIGRTEQPKIRIRPRGGSIKDSPELIVLRRVLLDLQNALQGQALTTKEYSYRAFLRHNWAMAYLWETQVCRQPMSGRILARPDTIFEDAKNGWCARLADRFLRTSPQN